MVDLRSLMSTQDRLLAEVDEMQREEAEEQIAVYGNYEAYEDIPERFLRGSAEGAAGGPAGAPARSFQSSPLSVDNSAEWLQHGGAGKPRWKM